VGHFRRLDPPIVHRDLKPTNVLLGATPAGRTALKVTDFGIGGVATAQAVRQTTLALSQARLMSQLVRGAYTPLYASHEQTAGSPPDPRDDVHALGVIWYQLMVGDVSRGAPTGLAWPKKLIEKGMNQEQVAVLASCFN